MQTNPSRRRVLVVMAALIPLTACAEIAKVIPVVTDGKLGALITGVQELAGGLSALPGWLTGLVPAGTLTSVVALVGQLGALAAQIGGVTSLSDAAPLVGTVETVVNGILALLGAGPLPSIVTDVLSAAATYLPTIIMLAGLLASPRAAVRRWQVARPMSVDSARAILLSAARR